MASDFAAMRRIVEQFAAKQQEMAQQIAALRTAEQNVSHELLTPLFLLRTHAIPVERSARGDTGAAAALNAYLHHAPWSRIALS